MFEDSLVVGMIIGAVICAIPVLYILSVSVVFSLAKRNLFWTIVQEGTAKAVLRFGKFEHLEVAYKGYELDEDQNVVKEGASNGKSHQRSGLRWIGIPWIYSVHSYGFRWVAFEQGEQDGKLVQKTIPHEEKGLDYIILQDDVYYSFLRDAETKDKVPVDVDLLLTIRVVNPYRAMFRVQNWLEATQNQFKPALRGFIATTDFDELISRKEGLAREIEELLQLGSGEGEGTAERTIGEYLERHYGVRVKKVGLVRIDPAGERGEIYQEAASKQWEAEKEKDRIEMLADAEVQRLERVYGTIARHGQTGEHVRTLEALERAGQGGNTIIFPLEILQKLFGKEKSDGS